MNLLQHKTKNPINTFIVPFVHRDYIRGCVESIWKFCSPEDHRLIVVNNACELADEEHNWLAENSHLYIRSYRNLGCAKAWNIGPQLSHTKFICIMGDDTRIIHREWWLEVYRFIKDDPTRVWFCHPCHLTQPSKTKGKLEPPEFTDEMWEETKRKSGDMVGRFNCLIIQREAVIGLSPDPRGSYLFNENLYPCQYLDRDFHNRLAELQIEKKGLHLPVWHMRAMTFQRGKMPLHDLGMSQPSVESEPRGRRHL